jgi:DNA polymerase III epsilon subunit-like protein
MPYQVPWLDIWAAAKSKLGNNAGLPNFKLGSVAKHFGIDATKAHDALEDLFMTIEIAKELKAMPDRADKDRNLDVEAARFSTASPKPTISMADDSLLTI